MEQKDGTTRPDGRQERKIKERKGKKRAATQSSKNQTSISMSSWWGKDDARDPREGRDRGATMITIIMKEKNQHH